MSDYINLSSHGSICFANLHLTDLTELYYGFNYIIKPVIRTSPIYKITDFEWVSITLLLALLVIRIRTLNDGVRASQSFFETAYLSHFSDFASLKNLSEFYFCLEPQIRMRIANIILRCQKKL